LLSLLLLLLLLLLLFLFRGGNRIVYSKVEDGGRREVEEMEEILPQI